MTKAPKKELVLDGLQCANCAAKIEEEVGALSGVACASMNFVTRTLTIEAENEESFDDVVALTSKIAARHEPDIIVREKAVNEQESNDMPAVSKPELVRLIVGAALFFGALISSSFISLPFWVSTGMYIVSYLLVGGEVVLKAFKNIIKGQVFDENFLMSIATFGAFAIQEFPEGVAVMLFYQVGEIFQSVAVNRSRRSIRALMDIRPEYANLKDGEDIRQVPPERIDVGSLIVIRPGEKVPLDGIVVEGRSMMDTSALTGEAVPRSVEPGKEVLAGVINTSGLLTVKVTKTFGESAVSKILELVQNAGSRKATTESFITKFARYYTPAVVFCALALAVVPPVLLPGASFSEWLYRALIFLVVSCPCALVVSIPLGFFGGIGGASRQGILVKGGNFLEALKDVDTVVFDKTGTLTQGVFKVTTVHVSNGETEESLLRHAAIAESFSTHPIALSILKAYGKNVDKSQITSYDDISGHGVKVTVGGIIILAGNEKLMRRENVKNVPPINSAECPADADSTACGTVVHVAVDGGYAGYIVISDEVKEDSAKAVEALRAVGVRKLVMLTGDTRSVGESIGRRLGLDEVYAGLLPHQKVEHLEALEAQKPTKGKLLFVGDGINDAPVLTRADVGIAMGGLGSDAAIEAADVVIMTDEPSKVAQAIRIAKKTSQIVWQNIFFAMGVKVIVLILGAGGVATMWEAVFADVGVALIAVLNAMRAMKMDAPKSAQDNQQQMN